MIEKSEEIVAKTHELIAIKLKQLTHNHDLTKIKNITYFSIIKSGIYKFKDEKIYLDTASVSNTDIVDSSTKITYTERPSRANMQPTKNSIWFAKLKDSPKYILVKEQSKRLLDNYIFSTGFMGLSADKDIINYLYSYILSEEFNNQKNLLSNGATMQGINNDIFNEILIPNINEVEAKLIGKELSSYVDLVLEKQEEVYNFKNIKSNLLSKYFN